MNLRLKNIVEEVKTRTPANFIASPFISRETGVDAPTLLQTTLVERNLQGAFTEADLEEAASEVGVAPEDIPGWLEGLASWYTD